jgi:hypothetical protein
MNSDARERLRIAVHESGHTIGALAANARVHAVTIIPHDDAVGPVLGECFYEHPVDVRADIRAMFCGLAAESVFMGTTFCFAGTDHLGWRDAELVAERLTNGLGLELLSDAYCREWANLEREALALMVRYRLPVARVASALLARGQLLEPDIARVVYPRPVRWTLGQLKRAFREG